MWFVPFDNPTSVPHPCTAVIRRSSQVAGTSPESSSERHGMLTRLLHVCQSEHLVWGAEFGRPGETKGAKAPRANDWKELWDVE